MSRLFRVAVPDEVALEFHDLEVIVIHLRNQAHCVVADGQLSELVREIHFLQLHFVSSHNGKFTGKPISSGDPVDRLVYARHGRELMG